MHLNQLTCLVPLYNSKRFLKIIISNIEEHLAGGASVIISDRHQMDNTVEILTKRYIGKDKVLIIGKNDAADWVDNINSMIAIVSTEFFRIIPHDDTASAESSSLLLNALSKHPNAALSSGIVWAENLWGFRLRKRDELNTHSMVEPNLWSPETAIKVYWEGRFAGAFKGVVRTRLIHKQNIFIKKTPTLIHSERTWLFALALIGPFIFVPNAKLIKRYHTKSTQRTWKYKQQSTFDAAQTMADYCDDLIKNQELAYTTKFATFYNALSKIDHSKWLVPTPSDHN